MARVLIYKECPTASNGNTTTEVYWDTEIRDQIRLQPANGQVCSPYNIGPNVLLDSWCIGTTKREIFSVWDGVGRPPMTAYTIKDTPNAASCSTGGGNTNPCGLKIENLIITETSQNVFSVEIIASGAEPLEYSLNDFADVQDDNKFYSLGPGTYEAYVRKKA